MDKDLLSLRKQILDKSSIAVPTPADCKRIALLISKSVNRNVSETTIKRLFGFAKATHNFSRYTMTALHEYIGEKVEGEPDFDHKIEKQFKQLREESKAISLKTLDNIKLKSTIRYDFTVNREFCEREFNYFYKKDYSFCAYVAQAGYGKSIMLAHLVEDFFLKDHAAFEKDLLWFINPYLLVDLESYDYNIESWLDNHLKHIVPQGLMNFFSEHATLSGNKIVLIVDGFNDVAIRKDHIDKLVNALADFIFSNSRYPWLKVVLSMRNIVWLNFYEKIRHSAHIKSKWYAGNYSAGDDFANVPPLTDKEIDSVISNFSIDVNKINPKTKIQLKTPFYFRFYYELLENGDESYLTDLTYYELISKYVHLKVNLSTYFTEKIILLKKIIATAAVTKKGNAIEKVELLTDIVTFKDAYEELLLHGILVEEKHYGGVLPIEIIRFQQAHVFEYFLFIESIDKHNRVVDEEYLHYIDVQYDNSPLALKLMQWTARYVVINDRSESLVALIRHKLPIAEKKYFLFFIAEMLESRSKDKRFLYSSFDHQKVHEVFIDQLLNFDFTDFYYKNTLKSLSKTATLKEHRFIYNALLGYVYFFELKLDRLEEIITELKELNDLEDVFFNKQIVAFELMMDCLIGNPENTEMLEWFVCDTEFQDAPGESLKAKEVVLYLCHCVVAMLYGKREQFVSTASAIHKRHPNILKRRSGLSLYLLLITNLVHLNSDLELSKRLTRHITLVKNNVGDNFHSFFYLMLCFLMTVQNLLKGNVNQSVIYLEEGLAIAELNKVHYLEKLFLFLGGHVYSILGELEKSEKCYYKLLCLVEEKKVSYKNALKFLRCIGVKDHNLFAK